MAGLPAIAAAAAVAPDSAPAMSGTGGGAYAHDDNGNRIASGWTDTQQTTGTSDDTGLRFKYMYDGWNRLVEITRAPVVAGAPGSSLHPERRRVGPDDVKSSPCDWHKNGYKRTAVLGLSWTLVSQPGRGHATRGRCDCHRRRLVRGRSRPHSGHTTIAPDRS